MGSMSVTNDILTEFRRKSSLNKEFAGLSIAMDHQEDPMEFPRSKLILLDKVLGETHWCIEQNNKPSNCGHVYRGISLL